ncbi:MAG: hypothetical protein RIM99_08455 [Cyclobacteriaceae bacterium]
MKKVFLLIISLYIILLSFSNCGGVDSRQKELLSSIDLLKGDITLCGSGGFGEVSFALSCKLNARETFDLAISLLHSFEYAEAEKAFVKVIDIDSECAMAYWGVAMSNFHSLWLQSGTDYLKKGSRILEAAQSLSISEREADYLNAIEIFYKDWETVAHKTRVSGFEKKMAALYAKYKDDKEAAIFYALALRATADPVDKSYLNQRKSGKILESLYPDQPNHPGIAHYIIHNYDYPELAELALPTARRYAEIAPSSAHAQHMPSHIFTRLGLWEESISSNINSTASALCYSESIDPEAHWDEELHGMDYLVYAYLQTGNNQKANEQYEYLKTFKKVFPENFKVAYTVSAIPARIALENKNWEEAANLEKPSLELDWSKLPWQESIYHFARALGSVRLGDLTATQKELAQLITNHKKLTEANDSYKANQVQIQIDVINAWIYFVNGKNIDAIALMKKAVDKEYNTAKHPVTPGEVLPAGELFGDLLLLCDQPLLALKTYEKDLEQHPNRFNGLYGAGVAAKAVGDDESAKKYFMSLLDQCRGVNSERLELIEAEKYLNVNPIGAL